MFNLALPIALITVTLFAFTGLLTFLMRRFFRMELTTALMATTLGGIQELSLMAAEMGCNTTQVVSLHTVRMIAVVCLFPLLLKLMMVLT